MLCTYIIVAHCVHVVFQVALPIVGKNDSTEFSISGKVETRVRGEHQETSDVSPAYVLLRT